MAAKRKRAQGPPQKPQFFKILLPCFLHRLRIPERFNRYIAGEMPKKATILSPLGGSWIVEVHSDNSFLCFGEGWQEFSHAHDLDVGYLVLFTYEGEMVFTVTIFDRTTCMKEYILAEEGNKVGNNLDSSVVVKQYGRPRREVVSMDSQNHNTKVASACREGSQFEIIMSSCNPCEEPNLRLPQQFVKCLGGENATLTTIFSTKGKAWHIKVHEDSEGFHFADGWQRFAEAHNLRIGDSLIFKHIGGLLFDVTIFYRSPSEGECNLVVENARTPKEQEISERGAEELAMHLSSKRVAKAMEPTTTTQEGVVKMEESAEHDWCEESPDLVKGSARILHFEIVMNFSTPYRRSALEIPPKFAASNGLLRIKQLFLRDPNGLLWPVRISRRQTNPRQLTGCAGWRDFCISNNVRDGDICSFQVEGKNVLYVNIHRGRHQKAMKASRGTYANAHNTITGFNLWFQGAEELAMHLSIKRVAKAMEPTTTTQEGVVKMEESAEHDWCEESPDLVKGSARILHFEIVMNFSTHYRRSALEIPPKFAASNDLLRIKQLFLRDPNGLLWPVRISHRQRNPRQLTGCAGWRDFCISNNVRDGDVCSFQLEGKNVLHVNIHRGRHQKAMKVSRGLEKLQVPLSKKVSAKAMEPPIGQNGLVKVRKFAAHDWDGGAPKIVDGSGRISHFEAVIDFSLPYRRYTLGIPAKFIASNGLSHVKQLFLRDPHGQLWPIRISHGVRGDRAYAGWHDFCIGNNLQAGDVCLFQLIKGKAELHVQIRRRRQQKFMKVSKDASRKSERLLSRHSAAGLRKSERYLHVQQFTCTIYKSYYCSPHLNIPSSFLSSVDLSSTPQITLIDAKARSWPVNIYHWKAGTKPRVTIGSGWKAFCIANAVEVGDKCIFELAPKAKNGVFHVSVIKRKAVDRS